MMKSRLKSALVILCFVLGTCTVSHAMVFGGRPARPEIDPSLAISGITLLVGSLAVLRVRRKK
jgi:LPXTG-motif cell wall-anchored protein